MLVSCDRCSGSLLFTFYIIKQLTSASVTYRTHLNKQLTLRYTYITMSQCKTLYSGGHRDGTLKNSISSGPHCSYLSECSCRYTTIITTNNDSVLHRVRLREDLSKTSDISKHPTAIKCNNESKRVGRPPSSVVADAMSFLARHDRRREPGLRRPR